MVSFYIRNPKSNTEVSIARYQSNLMMHKWYENKTLLNIFILLMVICFVSYYFLHWKWGLYLFLIFGTAIMIRGVTKITMRIRSNKTKPN